MRPLILAVFVSLVAGAGLAATPDDPEARYQALLAAAKAAAPNADWRGLRVAFAQRPGFKVVTQSAAKRQMFESAEKSDCVTALPSAKAVIEEAYIDIDAHLVAAFCEETSGATAAAQLDRDIGAGLIASVKTGDGLSPAAAFTPIDVDEEYAVMRALGEKITEQAMVQQDGHAYDALSAVDTRGQPATYYFLIDRVLAAEAAAMKPGDVSEGGPPSRTP
jgi:hypothetical protein